jgi:hypothetical protein
MGDRGECELELRAVGISQPQSPILPDPLSDPVPARCGGDRVLNILTPEIVLLRHDFTASEFPEVQARSRDMIA